MNYIEYLKGRVPSTFPLDIFLAVTTQFWTE